MVYCPIAKRFTGQTELHTYVCTYIEKYKRNIIHILKGKKNKKTKVVYQQY